MVDKIELVEGKSYFLVWYYDGGLSIPDIETYIYVGIDLLPDDKLSEESSWYFQNPDTYFKRGKFIDVNGDNDLGVLVADEETLEMIYDLDGLIVLLSEIK
jgi:hypothetical protein